VNDLAALTAERDALKAEVADLLPMAPTRRIISNLVAALAAEREARKRLANLLTAWMEFYGAEGMETETILAARAALGGHVDGVPAAEDTMAEAAAEIARLTAERDAARDDADAEAMAREELSEVAGCDVARLTAERDAEREARKRLVSDILALPTIAEGGCECVPVNRIRAALGGPA
jgi:hypothetical protein